MEIPSHSYAVSLAYEHTPLNPSQTGRYSIYLPRKDGGLSRPRWLVTYRDGLPTCRVQTNRAQCWLTTLIKANALTTTPRHQCATFIQLCAKCKNHST